MRFSRSDALVTAFTVALAALLFNLYLADVNRSFSAASGKAVGTIVFKKRNATRKTGASLGWERLRNAAPVFGGDTLRTSDQSEASVSFEDGTTLDLLDNTMLKINFTENERDIEFSGGAISLGGEGNATATNIRIGDKTLTASAASQVSLSGTGGEVKVEVASGTATIQNQDGSTSSIGENQEARIDVASGAVEVKPLELVPRSPKQNARLISAAGETPLVFACSVLNDVGGEVLFEIAGDENFTEATRTVPVAAAAGSREIEATVPLPSGVWYWRVRSGVSSVSSPRRLTLRAETPVALTAPEDGLEIAYRKKSPRIRFSWAEATDASAYVLEVSPEPSFEKTSIRKRTNVSSIDVADLAEGRWFWRVVPEYPFQRVAEAAKPVVRSFSIAKKEAMASVGSAFPNDGTLFNIQEASAGLSFSWKAASEAASYELVLSASKDLASPVARFTVLTPYLVAKDGLAPLADKSADWYWAVRWKDEEGNYSQFNKAQSLRGIDARAAVRLSYPPDAYTVADSLATNLRFTWKTSLQARTVFQVARDPAFSDSVLEENVSAATTLGRAWGAGTYYWRIKTYNADGTPFIETPGRRFVVASPFAAPALVKPSPNGSFLLRDGDEQELQWETGSAVDYVRLDLIRAGENTPRFSQTALTGNSIVLPLGSFPDGRYLVRLQGFAADKELSTRMIGYAGETAFTFRKLSFARLVSPADGAETQGLAALRQGVQLLWETDNPSGETTLVVSRDSEGRDPVYRKKAPARAETIRRLAEGTYYWTLRDTVEGFDVSAQRPFRFTVLPIPRLPAPELIAPRNGTIFDAAKLRAVREPSFEWAAVDGASEYLFTLTKEGEDKTVSSEKIAGTVYRLKDLSRLSRGTFRWTVEARSVGVDGMLEQRGTAATGAFVVDLPALERPRLEKTGSLYGL